MITQEQKLKLQAYLDGELGWFEARKIRKLIATDREAEQLFNELKAIRKLTRQNEPEYRLNMSREQYWSKIERAITTDPLTQEQESLLTHLSALFLMYQRAVVSVAVAILVLLTGYFIINSKPVEDYLVIIENTSEEIGSFSFRSQSENMFVVWIYNKDNPEASNSLPYNDELMFQ